MARKKKEAPHENHERWLVSYADFITLLFAFFVVMFASSQTDKGKAEQMSNSMKEALEGHHVSSVVAAILGGVPDKVGQGNAQHNGPGGAVKSEVALSEEEKKEKARIDQQLANPLLASLKFLAGELDQEIKDGQIQISMQPRGLVVSFAQAALFPSGEDVVSAKAYEGLEKVGAAISRLPNPVRLEGHTDSLRINTPRFKSNWDLSAARSIALLKILTERFAVPANRLSVAGYADTAPLESNDTEAGRARNRRVDIVVLNDQGIMGEPAKVAPPAPAVPHPALPPTNRP